MGLGFLSKSNKLDASLLYEPPEKSDEAGFLLMANNENCVKPDSTQFLVWLLGYNFRQLNTENNISCYFAVR